MNVTIYHNDKCSKSREALDYLRNWGIEAEVVNYLETPPSVEELRLIVRQMGVAPSSLIRPADFERLGLKPTGDAEALLEQIATHPEILHRPIVVVGEKARIARPPQLLDDLLRNVAPNAS